MALTDLAGFPMVMAVSQRAINAQMAKVYGQSTKEAEMFPNVPWNLGADDGSWSLIVGQFEAPEVDFDTTTKQGCRLKMTITAGNFTAYSLRMVNGKPEPVTIDTKLDGLTLYMTTPMKKVVHDTWSDEYFEVQGLFADLENVKLVELDLSSDPRVAVLGTIKASLETVLSDRLKDIGKADPKALLFGAVKIPKIAASEQSAGPLKPSASTYSTVRIPSEGVYKGGDLNYLLLLDDNKTIPTGAAAGAFNDSFVRSGADATLVLSDATLLEKFVKPIIESCWGGIKLNLDRGLFSSKPAVMSLANELEFGISIDNHDRTGYLKNLTAQVTGHEITVDYYYETSAYVWSGDIDISVTGKIKITLHEENGKLKSNFISEIVHISTGQNVISQAFADILTLGFNEIANKLARDGARVSINESLDGLSDQIGKALEAFMMPGQAVWKYSSATLDGQLYIEASYSNPEPAKDISSWAGIYNTVTNYWGDTYSPLIINQDGTITIAGAPITAHYDPSTGMLSSEQRIKIKDQDMLLTGIKFKVDGSGKNSFDGAIIPSLPDGPVSYIGQG